MRTIISRLCHSARSQMLTAFLAMAATVSAQLPVHNFGNHRCLWASVNTISDASNGSYTSHTGKLLISWRMLPSDTWDTSFLLFSRSASLPNGPIACHTTKPVTNSTCVQLNTVPTSSRVYYLLDGNYFAGRSIPSSITNADEKRALREAALDSMVLGANIYKDKVPYLTIPLKSTDDVCTVEDLKYQANDCTVADLDGDGEMEVIVKRLLTVLDTDGKVISDGTGGGDSDKRARHCVIWYQGRLLNGHLV